MNDMIPKLLISSFKYVYIVVFFALLSAVFYPILNDDRHLDKVIGGILTLLFSLVGGILLYKAATSAKRRGIFLGAGLGILALALFEIFILTDRVRLSF
ncbi:MAG: hypothetical protein D9C04_02995 [Nitrosopumilus sp. B06]|nr:MAG: hypothetical protein EB828_02470 [Nitrosopumilus sp. D6]RNJ80097.1 MAG: hypothetical protein D9C04_02995 [Nitrosopumilus sp. B06]